MNDINIALSVIGGMILVLGLFSKPIRNRGVFSFPLLALLLGIILGPVGFNLLDPARWGYEHKILEEVSRLTLAIGLMAIALRIPPKLFVTEHKPLGVLIGIVMPLMWIASSLLVYLFLDFPPILALLTGAIITPTDPVVASAVVTAGVAKENLPDRIRNCLSGESGANDGLAYMFVLLPVLLLTRPSGEAINHWLLVTVVREVGGAILLGALLGYGAGRLLVLSERMDYIEGPSFLSYTIALALLTVGLGKVVGTDGILAVFVAGVAFDNVVGGRERAEEENIQEAVNQFLVLPVFTLIGLMIPVDRWIALGWRGFALAAAVLALRRLPAILAVKPLMGSLNRMPDALFIGWFGPIGVSAIFYSMLALHRTGEEAVWSFGSLMICVSIVAHGTSSSPLTKYYGRKAGTEEFNSIG